MKDNYVKLINACVPDTLVEAFSNKYNIEKPQIENICLEIVARIFGDGLDLSKEGIVKRLKENCESSELKEVLVRIENKYGINAGSASKVLSELLPLLFQRISTLDNSYFEEKQEVQEETKEVPQVASTKSEVSMEELYKNIEKKAEQQVEKHEEIKKTRLSLFRKKHINKENAAKEIEKIEQEENQVISLVDKICMIAVGTSLLSLIVTIGIIFIKQI